MRVDLNSQPFFRASGVLLHKNAYPQSSLNYENPVAIEYDGSFVCYGTIGGQESEGYRIDITIPYSHPLRLEIENRQYFYAWPQLEVTEYSLLKSEDNVLRIPKTIRIPKVLISRKPFFIGQPRIGEVL